MAITQTGSTLTFPQSGYGNTGTASTTITVPADAELVIVCVSGFGGTAGYYSGGGMTFTKGAADTAMTVVSGGDTSTSYYQGAAFYLALPDTGSNKSLKWDWAGSAAPSHNDCNIIVTFWTGVDTTSPVRDTDGVQASGVPYTTPTLTATSGDLIVAYAFSYVGASEGSVNSWSNLTLLSQFTKTLNGDAAIATGSPSGNTTVAASTATAFTDGGIVAIVIKAAPAGPGSLIGTLTGSGSSVTDPSDATGSVVVSVDDIIHAVFVEQDSLTVTAVTDNLGNSYTACNAGTDAGVVTGRAFWSCVTNAGTLTAVHFDTTASSNNWVATAEAFLGPLTSIDVNPDNITSDITSPFTCQATGTLATANELIVAWGASNQADAWAATSPNLLAVQSTTGTISVPAVSAANFTSTSGADVTVTFPTGSMITGDWIYIFGGHFRRASVSIGPNSGTWEEVYSENAGGSTNGMGCWRQQWNGSDTQQVCYGSGNAADGVAYGRIILRDAGAIRGSVVVATGSSTNPNPGTATTVAGDCVLICAQSAVSDTSPGTVTSYTTVNGNANSTNDISLSMGYILAPATSENPAAWSSWSTGNWRALAITVAPSNPLRLAVGSQVVTATTSVAPAFTSAANPTQCILGISSFAESLITAHSGAALFSASAAVSASAKISAAANARLSPTASFSANAARRLIASAQLNPTTNFNATAAWILAASAQLNPTTNFNATAAWILAASAQINSTVGLSNADATVIKWANVVLAASAALTASTSLRLVGSSKLDSAIAFSANATVIKWVNVTLTTSVSLSASAKISAAASARLSPAVVFSNADAIIVKWANVVLAAETTLTSSESLRLASSSKLDSAIAFSANATVIKWVNVTLTTSVSLSASAKISVAASAILNNTVALNAAALITKATSATFVGSFVLNADAVLAAIEHEGAALLAGSVVTNAIALIRLAASARLSSIFNLCGGPNLTADSTLVTADSTNLINPLNAPNATVIKWVAVSIPLSGSISFNASVARLSSALFSNETSLTINAYVVGLQQGSALFAANSSFVSSGFAYKPALSLLAATSAFIANAVKQTLAFTLLSGTSSFVNDAVVHKPAFALMSGATSFEVSTDQWLVVSARFASASSLAVDTNQIGVQQGSALFVADNSLSVDSYKLTTGSTLLTSVSSLTVNVTAILTSNILLTSTSSLDVDVLQTGIVSGSALLATTGSLTVNTIKIATGSTLLTFAGLLTANSYKITTGNALLAAAGSIAVDINARLQASSNLNLTTNLLSSAKLFVRISLALSGSLQLSSSALLTLPSAALFTADGRINVAETQRHAISALLSSAGYLDVDVLLKGLISLGDIAVNSAVKLTVSTKQILSVSALLNCTSGVLISTNQRVVTSSRFAASGTVSGSIQLLASSKALLAAASTLTADTVGIGVHSGAARLSGESSLTVVANRVNYGETRLSGVAALTASAAHLRAAHALFVTDSNVYAAAILIKFSNALFSGESNLKVSSYSYKAIYAKLIGESNLQLYSNQWHSITTTFGLSSSCLASFSKISVVATVILSARINTRIDAVVSAKKIVTFKVSGKLSARAYIQSTDRIPVSIDGQPSNVVQFVARVQSKVTVVGQPVNNSIVDKPKIATAFAVGQQSTTAKIVGMGSLAIRITN